MIPYQALCEEPERFVAEVVGLSTGSAPDAMGTIPALRCFDEEYKVGSCLRSKNKFQTGSLLPTDGNIELAPFTAEQVATIEDTCHNAAARICGEDSSQPGNALDRRLRAGK